METNTEIEIPTPGEIFRIANNPYAYEDDGKRYKIDEDNFTIRSKYEGQADWRYEATIYSRDEKEIIVFREICGNNVRVIIPAESIVIVAKNS